MQKLLKYVIITSLMALLFMLPLTAHAASGTCGEVMSWTLDDAGTLTISGVGDMTDYTEGTAPWGTNITEVIIKGDVTSIGDYAFYNCDKLTTAMISNKVTIIGVAAFKGCTSLSTLEPLDAAADQRLGDANNDGVIDLQDALLLLNYCAGEDVLIADYNCDINGDGKFDVHDVLLIMQYCSGWDVENMPTDLVTLIRLLMAAISPCTHSGRTELSGMIEATLEQEGYTGDLYCLECGHIIEKGTVLPKLMELPVTGDSSAPMLWAMMLILSSCAFLLLRYRKKLN